MIVCVRKRINSTPRETCANLSEREKTVCARENRRAKTAERRKGRACTKTAERKERTYGKNKGQPNTDYDFFLFNGASSEQSAGEFLEHRAP